MSKNYYGHYGLSGFCYGQAMVRGVVRLWSSSCVLKPGLGQGGFPKTAMVTTVSRVFAVVTLWSDRGPGMVWQLFVLRPGFALPPRWIPEKCYGHYGLSGFFYGRAMVSPLSGYGPPLG